MKTSLILVPGLLCDDTVWHQQAAALSGYADIQIADNSECDSLAAMAQAIIDSAPAHFSIAGHSMGGRVALEVLRRVPERIERLALLDTGYHPLPQGEVGERETASRLRMVAMARELGMREMGVVWLQGMVHPERLSDSALVASILDMIERRTPECYAAQTRALLARPDAAPLLQEIRCPTLLLCGQQDSWSPVDRHRRMAAQIPSSQLTIVPECGHMSTMERPQAVSAALQGWLA